MATDFLEVHSWFDEQFKEFLRGRYYTFRIALNLLYQKESHLIVETGCTRINYDYGGGNSTYLFGRFISECGGHLTTIDIDPVSIEACRKNNAGFGNRITYVNEDSLIALSRLTKPIDLLYLDSMDVPEEGQPGDAGPGQKHNLKEFLMVEHLMLPGSMVLIDDNDMTNGGKSRLTKKYLKERGWRLVFDGDQTLWML